jgi:bifunctional non-homologous end joining protein LigD
MPPHVVPMQPTLVQPFHRDGWVYEEKVDGWRMLAFKDRGPVRLVSRQGVDHTARSPSWRSRSLGFPLHRSFSTVK